MENRSKKIIILLVPFFFLALFLVLGAAFLKKPPEPSQSPVTDEGGSDTDAAEKKCGENEAEKDKNYCLDKLKMDEVVKGKDLRNCLGIKTLEFRDECVKLLSADVYVNEKMCFAVSSEDKKKSCLARVIITKKDPRLCEQSFKGRPSKIAECKDWLYISEGENWKSFENINQSCEGVPARYRPNCDSFYGVVNAKTEEECHKISLDDYKKFCFTKVGVGGFEKLEEFDSDGDGVSDWDELSEALDPDNKDTDGDGLADGEEMDSFDTNPREKDTDSDGLTDNDEIKRYLTDPLKPDTNGNGASDGEEAVKGLDPLAGDAAKDGLSDANGARYGADPFRPDTNGNGISDGEETRRGLDPAWKGGSVLADSDKDGVPDLDEVVYGTDKFKKDTDGDGADDKREIDDLTNPSGAGDMDFDGDQLSDKTEKIYGTNPTLIDSDGDNLSDYEEIFKFKTDPNNRDTDGDGYRDGTEVRKGFNPLEKGK